MKKLLISVAALVTVGALVLTGCPEDTSGGANLSYVCENGTAADGNGAAAGVSNCQECKTGFTAFGTLGEEGSTCAYEYVCKNGNKSPGPVAAPNTSSCDSCMSGFGIVGTAGNPGSMCGSIAYTCKNGTATAGNGATPGLSSCESCISGFGIIGTAGQPGSTCEHEYVCENGNKSPGPAAAPNTSSCDSCMSGFGIVGTAGQPGSTCASIAYTCENGTATAGNGATPGLSSCESCISGFGIIGTAGQPGSMCGSIAYTCENGTATAGNGATPGLSSCDSCNTHYRISGTAGMAGSTCSANTCFRVYSDATRTNCDQLPVPTSGGFSHRVGGSNAVLTFDEIATGGADGSSNFRRLDFTGSTVHGARESFAVATIIMLEDYDATGKTLKFSIKSPATRENGGTNRIRVFYQASGGSQNRTAEDSVEVMFTNNDTWQTVEIPTTDFDFANPVGSSTITPATIRFVGFALLDANGLSPSGLGDQVIDIDEVRFEDAN